LAVWKHLVGKHNVDVNQLMDYVIHEATGFKKAMTAPPLNEERSSDVEVSFKHHFKYLFFVLDDRRCPRARGTHWSAGNFHFLASIEETNATTEQDPLLPLLPSELYHGSGESVDMSKVSTLLDSK
jgi:hypothetical protein